MNCQDCGEPLQDKVALFIHMDKIHNKTPKLICKLCDEECLGLDDFDKHLEFTHGTNHWSLNLAIKQINRTISKESLN
jgi:hypothetical protein